MFSPCHTRLFISGRSVCHHLTKPLLYTLYIVQYAHIPNLTQSSVKIGTPPPPYKRYSVNKNWDLNRSCKVIL